jgi:hypothetical protein
VAGIWAEELFVVQILTFKTLHVLFYIQHARRSLLHFEFEDRELVELLEGFTRTPENPVPVGFWEKNLVVMESVGSLARAVQKALILIADVRRAPNRLTSRRKSS